MLLFDSLRCMFPLLVGGVNLTQKEIDGAGRNLDSKSIRTVGGPLQLFVPIGAVFHEVVEQGIQMNNKLDSLLTASALTMADGLLGHTVTSADGKVTGIVKSLKIVSGGLIATLDNGKEIPITAGIKIS